MEKMAECNYYLYTLSEEICKKIKSIEEDLRGVRFDGRFLGKKLRQS
jgi:hypothetical protein